MDSNSKVLIGTTGDYPPLSLKKPPKQPGLEGFCIDICREVFSQLDLPYSFVSTTWPDIEADLENGAFHVGIGGLSITPKRQKKFLFSHPILDSKKVLLVHKNTQGNTLKELDRASVIFIANPGGTNEIYARQLVQKARLVVKPDIETLFERLSASHAQIMITDKIEANYRAKRHQCFKVIDIPELNFHQSKAFMFPKNQKRLQQNVNSVLEKFLVSKEFENLKKQWL